MVQPRRIPLTLDKKVVGFANHQYLEFYDLQLLSKKYVHVEGPRLSISSFWYQTVIKKFRLEFKQKFFNNPNKYTCFLPQYAMTNLPQDLRERAAFDIKNIVTIQDDQSDRYGDQITRFKPANFHDTLVHSKIINRFILDSKSGELVCPVEFKLYEQADKFKIADKEIIKKAADE